MNAPEGTGSNSPTGSMGRIRKIEAVVKGGKVVNGDRIMHFLQKAVPSFLAVTHAICTHLLSPHHSAEFVLCQALRLESHPEMVLPETVPACSLMKATRRMNEAGMQSDSEMLYLSQN
jgi:hypothetical protein